MLTAAFSSFFFSFYVLSAAGPSTTLISARLIINYAKLAAVDSFKILTKRRFHNHPLSAAELYGEHYI